MPGQTLTLWTAAAVSAAGVSASASLANLANLVNRQIIVTSSATTTVTVQTSADAGVTWKTSTLSAALTVGVPTTIPLPREVTEHTFSTWPLVRLSSSAAATITAILDGTLY